MDYSVLMSVYQDEKAEYLASAIKSMLDQTVPPSDFVLVCDGPLNGELDKVIADFKESCGDLFNVIRLERNLGLGAALGIALPACKCEIVARMDSDDIALPDRMEKQLAFLEEHKDISVVGGQIAEFKSSTDHIVAYRTVPVTPEEIEKKIPRRNPMNHMTVTLRKSDVEKVGGYQDFLKCEDYYLWARVISGGCKMANLPDVCVYARVDNGMYKRRAGMLYFKRMVALQKFLRKCKIVSLWQYVTNICIRFCSTILFSNNLREKFYNKFLRKRKI